MEQPAPEVAIAVTSEGKIVGATLGNGVYLSDVEGRSALLLPKAKDNNASGVLHRETGSGAPWWTRCRINHPWQHNSMKTYRKGLTLMYSADQDSRLNEAYPPNHPLRQGAHQLIRLNHHLPGSTYLPLRGGMVPA